MSEETARVLVVDDNEMNRDMLSRRLKRQKYAVEVAEDGARALALVKEQSFDLMLLDIMMPNISGYDVLEQVKADPKTQHLPVIMISAVDDLDSVVRCIEMGAEDYLFKPFNPVLLKARVGASLSKNRGAAINTAALQDHLDKAEGELDGIKNNGILSDTQTQHLDNLRQHIESIRKLL